MYKNVSLFICLLLLLSLTGCSNYAILTGKVIDASGDPISELKIIANPIIKNKKNKQVFVMTGLDGTFEIKKLGPSAEYTLKPFSKSWDTKNMTLDVKTAQAGKTSALPRPIVFRYKVDYRNIITDSLTGLEWYAYGSNGKDLDWKDSEKWAIGLDKKLYGFGKWRMPTVEELKSLYDENIDSEYKIDPIFKLNSCCVWSGEKIDTSKANSFSYKPGIREMGNLNNRYMNRAFAVSVRSSTSKDENK